MANAYSILHNYHQDLYSPDYNLIGSVLQYKQGKLDANRQKLQSVYDKLSVIDVAKQEDKDYIEGRLQAAQSIVNKYAAMDLSSDGFANDLIGQLTTTIDDNVKNAVIGTRIYRAEQAAWEKLKEDNFDLYNEGNRRFAQRASDNWLTDGKAGTKYSGGGGVIEYDDYQKRWQESIPDIAKALGENYEYVTQENGVGMFIDNVTKRAVDRGTISSIMDSILGEKGRRQQMIDAWNRYDGVEPAVIKEQYDSYLNPKIDEADRRIKNLKNLVENSSGEMKELYQQSLDAWQERKNSYTSHSFDNLVKKDPNGGVTTAYQTMFADQTKQPWLDVYTYDEKVVERKVDDNHVKTLEFQEKVREFNLNYDLKLQEAALKKAKAGVGGQLDANGMPTVIEQDLSIVESEDPVGTNLRRYQESYYEGIEDLKSVVGNLSGARLIDIGAQLEGKDLSNIQELTLNIGGKEKKFSFGQMVTENGKEVWKENGNRAKLLSFMNKSYGTDPVLKEIRSNINGSIEAIQNRLVEEYQVNPGIARDFAKFNKEIIRIGGTDSEPQYKVVDVESGDRYKELLKKAGEEGLTDAEQLTLDLYVTSQYIADPKVNSRVGREAYVQMREDLVKKIGYTEFEKLPQSVNDIREANWELKASKRTFVTTMGGEDGPVAEVMKSNTWKHYNSNSPIYNQIVEVLNGQHGVNGDGSKELGQLIIPFNKQGDAKKIFSLYNDYLTSEGSDKTKAKKALDNLLNTKKKTSDFISGTAYNDDAYLYNLGSYDTKTDKGKKQSFDDMIKTSNTVFIETSEAALEHSYLAPEVPQYMIRKEDSRYKALADLVEAQSGTRPNGPISIALEVTQDGEKKGVVYQYTDGDGNIINSLESEMPSLTEQSLIDINLGFASTKRTPYNAKYGDNAPKVQLGGSKPSPQVERRIEEQLRKNDQALAMNDSEAVGGLLKLAGDISPIKKAEITQQIIDFRAGKYNFTLESSDTDRRYMMMMYKGNKLVDQRVVSSEFSEAELADFLATEALYLKHAMFNDYLNNSVLRSEVDKELQISQAEVAEFLRGYGQR